MEYFLKSSRVNFAGNKVKFRTRTFPFGLWLNHNNQQITANVRQNNKPSMRGLLLGGWSFVTTTNKLIHIAHTVTHLKTARFERGTFGDGFFFPRTQEDVISGADRVVYCVIDRSLKNHAHGAGRPRPQNVKLFGQTFSLDEDRIGKRRGSMGCARCGHQLRVCGCRWCSRAWMMFYWSVHCGKCGTMVWRDR